MRLDVRTWLSPGWGYHRLGKYIPQHTPCLDHVWYIYRIGYIYCNNDEHLILWYIHFFKIKVLVLNGLFICLLFYLLIYFLFAAVYRGSGSMEYSWVFLRLDGNLLCSNHLRLVILCAVSWSAAFLSRTEVHIDLLREYRTWLIGCMGNLALWSRSILIWSERFLLYTNLRQSFWIVCSSSNCELQAVCSGIGG